MDVNKKIIMNLITLLLLMIMPTGCSRKGEGINIETQPVTEITGHSASSGGEIIHDGGFHVMDKGLCFGSDIDPDMNDGHVSAGSGSEPFECTMTGLIPDKDYHVRAYAADRSGIAYGNDLKFRTGMADAGGQIIADHTVVDRTDDIPQYYIDKVREMWLVYAGESHSAALRTGLALLEGLNPLYQVNITESGTPEGATSSYLRASRATWGNYENASGWIYSYGEEDWYTNSTALSRTKAGITYCNTHGLEIGAIGFGWCWDPHIDTPGEFNLYVNATEQYVTYCRDMGYRTQVYYTTGTVDMYYEGIGYAKHLGYEMIREHVRDDPSRILFDYADILCYDEGSDTPNTTTWDGHEYPIITPTNLGTTGIGHIGSAGAIRLAKATWWMLARMAGWDGEAE
ncbi:MAG: hypothetical protein WAW07_13280 [Bacteroidales bacterium]